MTHNPREELNSVILLQRGKMQCDAFVAEELLGKEKRRGMSLYVSGQRRKAHTVQQNDKALPENHVAFDIHGCFCQFFFFFNARSLKASIKHTAVVRAVYR